MNTLDRVAHELSKKQLENKQKQETAHDKQEFFNGLADLGKDLADYMVDELKQDNKVEVTNFPEPIKEVKISNLRGIFGLLESISKTLRNFKLPNVFKVEGEVKVKNQIEIPKLDIKIPEPPKVVGINALPGYIKENLEKIAKKELQVNVEAPIVNVPQTKVEIDLSVLEELIKQNNELLKALDKPQKEIDLSEVIASNERVKDSIEAIRFPIPNFSSSWQKSLTMQSEDLGKTFTYTTVGGKKALESITFTGIDGKSYRKTYSYTSNDPDNPDGETAWTEV